MIGSSLRSGLLALSAAAGVLLAQACAGSSSVSPDASGAAGKRDAAYTDAAGTGAAGTGAAGTTGAAGAPAQDGGVAGSRADASAGERGPGFGGVEALEDLSTVKPSAGCGKDPGQPLGSWQLAPAGTNKYMYGYAVSTPDTAKGSFTRRYFVKLPATYDKDKPYRVIYEGPACGGVGYEVPAFDTVATGMPAAGDVHGVGVIQVGLTPEPTVAAGCFDDQSGADTIEKSFIETLAPVVASSFCIDEHRVFIAGHDSGGSLANHLGRVYGSRIFRAIAPSSGGLPMEGLQPCLTAGLPGSATTVGGCLPVPGIWWHDVNDMANAYSGTQQAVEAALVANHCTNATFAAGPKKAYAMLALATCLSYSTCPPEFPIVVCTSMGQNHNNQLSQADSLATTWTFFSAF
jgi:poly(3-hydroxybutyrate) depolymerase